MTDREHIAALVFASMWTHLEQARRMMRAGHDVRKLWAEEAVRAADALIEELKK